MRILLTKRTETVKYHKGEISFPGGTYEEDDGDAERTAVRECGEEIGVRPDDIDIIGRLDDMATITGFVITPFVAFIPCPYDFRVNPGEVHHLIYLPLSRLMEAEPETTMGEHEGEPVASPAISYEGERIWGATCKLLLQLKDVLNT